jgi:cellobiose transport system permease protein
MSTKTFTTSTGVQAERKKPHRARKYLPFYLSVSPYLLLFAVFGLLPVIFTMVLAFTNWSGLGDATFIGIENFKFLIHDTLFYKSIGNTLILFVMSTFPNLILATFLALLLNKTLRFSTTYRVVYLLPNITSVVAMGILFGSIFSSRFGVANALIQMLGGDNIAWLQTEWGIKIAISCLSIWTFVGYNALLILAGLQAIPKEISEAAQLDGAGAFKEFFFVTLPQLRPIVLFITLTSTIGSLQSFTETQVLTSSQSTGSAAAGGVNNSGLTMVLYFFSVAFQEHRFGYGATIAWGVFVIVLFFTIINWIVVRGRKK